MPTKITQNDANVNNNNVNQQIKKRKRIIVEDQINNNNATTTSSSSSSYKYYLQPKRFEGHDGGITSCRFSPNGKFICSTSIDQAAFIWDVNTSNRLNQLKKGTAGGDGKGTAKLQPEKAGLEA